MYGFWRKTSPYGSDWDEDKVENELPVEMWVEIFEYLEPQDELSVETTCHLFHDIIKSRKDDKLDHFIADRKKKQKKEWKRKKKEARLEHQRKVRRRQECCENAIAVPCGCFCCMMCCFGKVFLQWLAPYVFCPCLLSTAPILCLLNVIDDGCIDGCNKQADDIWESACILYSCGACDSMSGDDACPCVPYCDDKMHNYCC